MMSNPQNSLEAIALTTNGVRISVHAQPGAKRTELIGLHGDALKIRVHAPPVDGKANDELLRFLSQELGVPRSHITLVRGNRSRTKVFEVESISVAEARTALGI